MDGLKKILTIFALAVLVIGFSAPAMAQSYGGRYGGMPQAGQYQGGQYQGGQYQGGQQQMPQQGGQQQQQQGGLKESKKDLMATMEGMNKLSLFVAAVKATGNDKILGENEGPFMVFAPSDKAVEKYLGISDPESITEDSKAIKAVVDNCIVTKVTEPSQGSDSVSMTTKSGKAVTLKKTKTGVTVNGKNVVDVIKTENGMLIVIDGIVGM